MPLETATYISQLNPANPASTDVVAQGDDHIRLIKAALLATFPNINAPITVTDEQINALATVTTGGTVGSVPTGSIILWYGASTAVPSGYGICNGSTYAKSDGSGNITSPDLRDKVVMGVGTTIATVGASIGAATASATTSAAGGHSHGTSAGGAHSHSGVTIQGHALTISEIPAHTHGYDKPTGGGGSTNGAGGTGTMTSTSSASAGAGAAHTHGITFPGSDGTHTHTTDSVAAHTHSVSVSTYQPTIALHYIIKL